ncbi:MAG: hypothetical protein KatS3mg076_3110 [Candidatus Binatia bacterium]|nr:MAG: hypothetical protein KatS3mg076_3110 [Candidatus Binatia bacterium]
MNRESVKSFAGRMLLASVLWALFSLPAGAEEKQKLEPWILDQNNWQQAEGLLPDVVLKRVKDGDYWFKVKPVDPEEFKSYYSKAFWEASEANDGKYDVDPETCGLKDVKTGKMPDFYFGFPFPKIDPKDPMAACKMAWNFTAANQMGEGQGATFTLNGIDTSGEFKRIKLWLHIQSFLGRPGGPIPNPENLRDVSMSNVLEPQDVDGVAGLTKRINDWYSQDKAWFYVPSTRRVRRVNAATRSDPVAGLDIFADDLNCYGGKTEYYTWKLIGEGQVLAPVLDSDGPLPQKWVTETRAEVPIPYFKGAYETPGAKGVPWLVVENLALVPRPVWILEGQSQDPYYNFGKVIMYMDKVMYRIWWKLVHNRAGEYFYNAACAYHWSTNKDGTFKVVTPNMVVGVNDKTNRACLAGRYSFQFIERKFPEDYFSLRTLTTMSD